MNKKKLKIVLSWIIVLLWMGVIFLFSDMRGVESVSKSRKIIDTTLEASLNTTNHMGLTDKHPSEDKIKRIVKKLDIPFRKCMHISEYFILALLLYHAFYRSDIRGKKVYFIVILFCFIYAISDEYHQSFVQRTSSFKDVLIDTSGGILGSIFIYIILKKLNNLD